MTETTDVAGSEDGKTGRRYLRFLFIEGVLLVILGLASLALRPDDASAMSLFLGWIFVVAGSIGGATSILGRHGPGFGWSLMSAIITFVAGCALIAWTTPERSPLVLVITIFLILDGILTMLFGLAHRKVLYWTWILLILIGLVDFALAALVLWALPAAVWALGAVICVDLNYAGWSLIAISFLAPRARESA